MRHFLIRELDAALAVACLSCCVQPSTAGLDPILGPCATHRVTPLCGTAMQAEAVTSITPSAKPELHATPAAYRDPIGF
jgi:hypothetical protein